MRFASVCDGIGCASVAWDTLGWKCAWRSEIDEQCNAVTDHRWPGVPNLGDLKTITPEEAKRHGTIDVLVGGTPCQSFSTAGGRGGMDDPRGQLALHFLRLAGEIRPRWVVWENVPGVLSSNRGRDFGAFLHALGECGYGFAYRVLDAQYFGLAQRRRRVFVVAHLGDWRRAAAVLLDRQGLRGDPPPRREEGEVVAPLTASGIGVGGPDLAHAEAGHLLPVIYAPQTSGALRSNTRNNSDAGQEARMLVVMAHGQGGAEIAEDLCPTLTCNHEAPILAYAPDVAHTLRGEGHDAGEDGTGRGTPTIAYILHGSMASEVASETDVHTCLAARMPGKVDNSATTVLASRFGVRRLTPRECERLMGLPDDYTFVPFGKKGKLMADSPRYRMIGNGIAVPVLRRIGERIWSVEGALQGNLREAS